MNSQRKCGAQGAAVLLQEFLWLGECAARSSCHAYNPGYKMIIEKDIHMIWHSQNGIHMALIFFGLHAAHFRRFSNSRAAFRKGTEYIVDAVTCDGVHKITMVWVYDRRAANEGTSRKNDCTT